MPIRYPLDESTSCCFLLASNDMGCLLQEAIDWRVRSIHSLWNSLMYSIVCVIMSLSKGYHSSFNSNALVVIFLRMGYCENINKKLLQQFILQEFIYLIKYRLLAQSSSHVYRTSHCTSYHRVVTDTQEAHHFYVSRNWWRTSELSVWVHTTHSVSHTVRSYYFYPCSPLLFFV